LLVGLLSPAAVHDADQFVYNCHHFLTAVGRQEGISHRWIIERQPGLGCIYESPLTLGRFLRLLLRLLGGRGGPSPLRLPLVVQPRIHFLRLVPFSFGNRQTLLMFREVGNLRLERPFLRLDSLLSRFERYPLEPLDFGLVRALNRLLHKWLVADFRLGNRLNLLLLEARVDHWLNRGASVSCLKDRWDPRFPCKPQINPIWKLLLGSGLVTAALNQTRKASVIHVCQYRGINIV
jgi:hypothetical protein